jgi:hypothetical protein
VSKADNNNLLESVSPERRDFLRKSVKAGFALPVVGTFTMSGLMATPAAAQANMSVG